MKTSTRLASIFSLSLIVSSLAACGPIGQGKPDPFPTGVLPTIQLPTNVPKEQLPEGPVGNVVWIEASSSVGPWEVNGSASGTRRNGGPMQPFWNPFPNSGHNRSSLVYEPGTKVAIYMRVDAMEGSRVTCKIEDGDQNVVFNESNDGFVDCGLSTKR